jgi:hypothetical protein
LSDSDFKKRNYSGGEVAATVLPTPRSGLASFSPWGVSCKQGGTLQTKLLGIFQNRVFFYVFFPPIPAKLKQNGKSTPHIGYQNIMEDTYYETQT